MDSAAKTDLRRAARERRLALWHAGFAHAIARHAPALNIAPGRVVGGYHALPDEADPQMLLDRLASSGCTIVLPRVVAKGQPLAFHRVPDGEAMPPGAYGIHEPLDTWPRATPDVLLVPLLAFDAAGHRLGYGGGFYDRTLQVLKVHAIGIAYAGQEVSSLPQGAHDMGLDAIVTEQGIRHFA